MSILNMTIPPFPYYITAGDTLYSPGTVHRGRINIGAFDLIFVEYGELYLTDDSVPYTISGGNYLILSADGRHFAQKPVDRSTLFHWLHFKHSGQYVVSAHLEHPVRKKYSLYNKAPEMISIPMFGHLDDERQQEYLRLHRSLVSVIPDPDRHTYVPIENRHRSSIASQRLFLHLLELLKTEEKSGAGDWLADSIMAYLEQCYNQPITLELLSQVFNFSSAHILRVFKKEYGMSVIESLNQIRLSNAKELLQGSSLSIGEVAAEVGFSSSAYFDRGFKKQNGISPREYRFAEKINKGKPFRTDHYTQGGSI